jgi:hypothetical protein
VLSLCCHNAVRVLSQCCQSDSKLNVFKYIRQVAIGTWRLAKTKGGPFIPLINTDDTDQTDKLRPQENLTADRSNSNEISRDTSQSARKTAAESEQQQLCRCTAMEGVGGGQSGRSGLREATGKRPQATGKTKAKPRQEATGYRKTNSYH